METKYSLYGEELNKKLDLVGTDKPIKLEFMSNEDMLWREAEILVYEGETKNAEATTLLGPFSEPYGEGKYYVKIERILPSPLDDDE